MCVYLIGARKRDIYTVHYKDAETSSSATPIYPVSSLISMSVARDEEERH